MCIIKGCENKVTGRNIMCKSHWDKVPNNLKDPRAGSGDKQGLKASPTPFWRMAVQTALKETVR